MNQASTPLTVYPLYLGRFFKIMVFGILALFVAVGFLLLARTLAQGPTSEDPLWFMVLWLVFVLLIAYKVLSIPHRIELLPTGRIRFVSLFRKIEVSPGDIESIRPERGQYGILVVRHRRGKVRLLNQFDGFHEFLTELKADNPRVELRGC